MKKYISIFLSIFILLVTSCHNENYLEIDGMNTFGAFLGLADNKDNYKKLLNYDEVAIEIEEYSEEHIQEINAQNITIYAYLSVGSLESYKDYYNKYKDLTFMDYDNWPDERWIDVSNESWQNELITQAAIFKSLGAKGLFLDNYDVYSIVCDSYECSDTFKEAIYNGLNRITELLSALDMKLMINSGTEYLNKLAEENEEILRLFNGYCQETVFSSILDYDKNKFGIQDEEDTKYYIDEINMLKKYGIEIYLIEYTNDSKLINKIVDYCKKNNYKFYISLHVDLD